MKRVDGELAVSRALGDFQYKDEERDPRQTKVTALPELEKIPRDVQNDQFIVIACDGIWDVMTNEVRDGVPHACHDFEPCRAALRSMMGQSRPFNSGL